MPYKAESTNSRFDGLVAVPAVGMKSVSGRVILGNQKCECLQALRQGLVRALVKGLRFG